MYIEVSVDCSSLKTSHDDLVVESMQWQCIDANTDRSILHRWEQTRMIGGTVTGRIQRAIDKYRYVHLPDSLPLPTVRLRSSDRRSESQSVNSLITLTLHPQPE